MHRLILIVLLGCLSVLGVGGEEAKIVRLAVGPYFAPAGNERLQNAANFLPELLTAELSRDSKFEIVERDKVRAILGELNLTAESMNSPGTILKLGRLLGCDRLVCGTLFVTDGSVQAWTKLIDTRTSVVLDLEAVPYDGTNWPATAKGIATFLTRAKVQGRARQFIALGRLENLSVSTAREDWTPRLRTVIEKHFLESGFGVVEREAMTPIIQEHQLEDAGLTGSDTNRVRLQPAVWILDGGWRWIRDTEDKINVVLRLQKVAGKEQMIRMTSVPGVELEQRVLNAIKAILASGESQASVLRSISNEADVQQARAMELATVNAPISPSRYSNNPDLAEKLKQQNNRRAALEGFEKTIMLDPSNLGAKRMLALGLLDDEDVMQRQRATNLLQELAGANNPGFATWAKERLGTTVAAPVQEFTPLEFNEQQLRSNPNSVRTKLILGGLLCREADMAQRQRGTNMLLELAASQDARIASEAEMRLGRPIGSTSSPGVGPKKFDAVRTHTVWFKDVTAVGMETEGFLIATGNTLRRVRGGVGRSELVELPFVLTNTITAVTADDSTWWLGTLGGGLIRVQKSNGAAQIYGEKDGLLMPSIATLASFDDKLWIGFGFRESGGFGYLDLKTDKFIGLAGDLTLFKSREERSQSLDSRVTAIKTWDMKTIWVASVSALHRYDADIRGWKQSLSVGPACASGIGPFLRNEHGNLFAELPRFGCLTANSNYVAVGMPQGGINICNLSSNQWSKVNLASDFLANQATALRVDHSVQNLLWVGGKGKLYIIDMAAHRVIGVCDLVGFGNVIWLTSQDGFLVIVAAGRTSGEFALCWLRTPTDLQSQMR